MSHSPRFRGRRTAASLALAVLTTLTPVLASSDPAGAATYPRYSSHPLAGTVGTAPETTRDPDHPHRVLCYKSPCSAANATYSEEVRTMVVSGNRLFLGGFFSGLVDGSRQPVSPRTPFLAELDATTGRPAADQTFARNAAPDGTVESMVVSPSENRLYVGGRFSHIGGGAANRVAALNLTTGTLDPTFHSPGFDDDVRSIALSGGRLFVGGQFLKAGGRSVPGITALNAGNGSLVAGWTPPANYGGSYIHDAPHTEATQGVVIAIAVAAGGKLLMVGGDFQHLGWTAAQDKNGLRYGGLVALNTSDGKLASWHPFNQRPVLGMAMSPDGRTLYTAEGGSGGWVGAFNPGGTENQLWFGRVDGDVMSVTATDQRVYAGGHFDAEVPNHNDPCLKQIPTHCTKTGSHHRHLVAFSASTGKADPSWTAQSDTPEGPTYLLAGPKALYVGGNFTNLLDRSTLDGGKGIPHPGFGMFPG
ncbi:MAG TPA: delta-60 repeat domain-containing protein [Acidimicrobiia bacterium]|nr:delta-60 repeat domain-containing protein [Acidimicrobiia bacterium]